MSAGERAFIDRVSTALWAKWNSSKSMDQIEATTNLYRNRYPGRIDLIDRALSKFRKSVLAQKSLTSSDNQNCSGRIEVACLWTQKMVEVA